MSNKNLNKKLKREELPTILLSNLIPLHISKEIQDKIDYLCQTINLVEWSGVLFYSVKGKIKDFDKVEFIVEDIFPMDKGTTAATGYELGDEIIDYRMSNPKSLSWKLGMIHSHHSMSSYFSGTDMEELEDNTEFHNYYLSLVVNNMGKMVAKVAFRGDIKGYECKDEQGSPWNLKLSKSRQAMFTFDCEIKSDKVFTNVPKDFAERTAAVIKECDAKRRTFTNATKNLPTTYKKPIVNNKNLPQFGDHQWFQDEEEQWNQSFNQKSIKKSKKDMSEDERYWDFTRYLIRLGGSEDLEMDTLEDALEDVSVISENVSEFAGKMVTMYPALFEKYWDIFGEINTERFSVITEEVVGILENYEGLFDIVDPLVNGLEFMIEQMKVLEDE